MLLSPLTFELWHGSSLVHTSASLADSPDANPYQPTFLSSGYGGQVDKVVVSGVQGYFSMDDFSFHRAAANTVPEAPTYALALLAFGAASFARKRRAG